jgi:NAD(P)-dependent dehydrogenase (short-subunit alcohol dehydrogenase family)
MLPPSAIVTGAASGLGRALCLRLARDGWRLAVCDLDEQGSAETLRLVEEVGGSGRIERLDVANRGEWEALRERLKADWPHVDLLVNNAGVGGAGDVGLFSLEDWHWLLNIDLWGAIYGCHTFLDWLKASPRGGYIINVASMAGYAAPPGMAAYNVAKAGVVALSETMYGELRPQGVGVSVVCPTFFRTNIIDGSRMSGDEHRQVAEKLMGMSRMTADDVAHWAIQAMHRKQLHVIVSWRGRLIWRLKRLAPRMFTKFAASEYKKMMDHARENPEPVKGRDVLGS